MPPPTAPPPAAPAASTGAFGSQGQVVLSIGLPFGFEGQTLNGSPQFAIVHESVSMGGGSTTFVNIAPAADYFLSPNISVGGIIGFASGNLGGVDVTAFGIGARVGYNVPLADAWSIWPRLGLEYIHASASSGGNSASGYDIPLSIDVPILWHPAAHFFLGLGPVFSTELVSKTEGVDQAKTTDIGINAVIGGYFGV
jgi:hypothetical protein